MHLVMQRPGVIPLKTLKVIKRRFLKEKKINASPHVRAENTGRR
jgi:hypothetical protein